LRRRSVILLAVLVMSTVSPRASADGPSRESAIGLLRGDRSPKVRAQAALTLRATAEEAEVRAALLLALDDPDAIVRAAAANALGAVPHTDAFEPLSRRTRDRDPLVAKWVGWALRRTLAAAPRVHVAEVVVRANAPARLEALKQVFEGAMLGVLLQAGGRFEVDTHGRTYDFSPEGEAGAPPDSSDADDRKALELMRQGRFDAAALSGADGPGPDDAQVTIRLKAEVEAWDASPGARARARLAAFTPEDALAWEVVAEGVGRIPQIPEDERDEYTMAPRPEDLRTEAVDAAGRAVAEALVRNMATPESPPGDRVRQVAR
jgi:hypothetical protein